MVSRKAINSKYGGNGSDKSSQQSKSCRGLVKKKGKLSVKSLRMKLAKQRVKVAKMRLKTNRLKEDHDKDREKLKQKELEIAQLKRLKDLALDEDAFIRRRIDRFLDVIDAHQEHGFNKANSMYPKI